MLPELKKQSKKNQNQRQQAKNHDSNQAAKIEDVKHARENSLPNVRESDDAKSKLRGRNRADEKPGSRSNKN
jgi:hypothetical protein